MTPYRMEQIGDCTLYLGNCSDLLPTLGTFDAVVTDPPYGINAARDRKSQKYGWKDYPDAGWDKVRPSEETIAAVLAASKNVVLWGGNYFADLVAPSSKWLVWDKGQTDFSLADCELAWCSFDGALRRLELPRSVALQDGKEHPTQKPVELMRWCIEQLPKGCSTILDPFMGSGTTGVAAVKMGRKFTGIEVSEHYFDVARRRIEVAYAQPDMFVPAPSKAVQEAMPI